MKIGILPILMRFLIAKNVLTIQQKTDKIYGKAEGMKMNEQIQNT